MFLNGYGQLKLKEMLQVLIHKVAASFTQNVPLKAVGKISEVLGFGSEY